MELLLTAAVVAGVVLVLLYLKFGRLVPTTIPGIKGTPFVGNVHTLLSEYKSPPSTHLFLQHVAKHSPTKLASWHMLQNLCVVVSDASMVRDVLRRGNDWGVMPQFQNAFGEASRGLLVLEGDVWSRHRRLLHKAFEPAQLRQVAPATNKTMDLFVARWERHGHKGFGAKAAFAGLTMDVIGLCAFNESFHGLDETHTLAADMVTLAAGVDVRIPVPKSLWWLLKDTKKFNAAKRNVTTYLKDLVTKRRAVAVPGTGDSAPSPRNRDILSLMLATQSENTRDMPLTDDEIVAELQMFFAAGHETSSNVLTWTTMMLAQHPAVLDKMAAEVARVCGDGVPTHESLKQLHYCEAVLKESMRLRPVVSFTARAARKPVEIGKHHVPAGTIAFMNFLAIHRDPHQWTDADKFVPQRWLDTEHPPPSGSFFPFGDGRKACIGKVFAMMEMKVVLARLCQFLAGRHLALTPGQNIVAQSTVTLNPVHDVLIDIVD